MTKSLFWNKVDKCKHVNISPSYYKSFTCETPYCIGEETYCLDCKTYISKCGCGFWNGVSGWSQSQWKKYFQKKEGKLFK